MQRNGTLTEVSTINTGQNGMEKFGYLDHLNGMDHLPFWDSAPCTNISASEGSFFPPREFTESDMRYVYDKDLCRIIPLEYRSQVYKDGKNDLFESANRFTVFPNRIININTAGIPADLYELPENAYGDAKNNPDNACYDSNDYDAIKGLQNISPCQYSKCRGQFAHFHLYDKLMWFPTDCRCPRLHIESTFLSIWYQPIGRSRRSETEQKHSWNIFQDSTGNFNWSHLVYLNQVNKFHMIVFPSEIGRSRWRQSSCPIESSCGTIQIHCFIEELPQHHVSHCLGRRGKTNCSWMIFFERNLTKCL